MLSISSIHHGSNCTPPPARPDEGDILRLHGNGCALARTAGPAREGTAAPWLLAAALLAARRRRIVLGAARRAPAP
jgi:MYXO-CTERM domain-containing protein